MEFLDWTGVEEHERKRVLRFLSDDCVKIPGRPTDISQYNGKFGIYYAFCIGYYAQRVFYQLKILLSISKGF